MNTNEQFMEEAIQAAMRGILNNEGGPFGAIVVKNGKIIGKGNNQVTSSNDPTAHAEVMAIRNACKNLGDFQLTDCIIYTSCEPCPMCLGAIYWARPSKVFFGCTRQDAAKIGFDDEFLYTEMSVPIEERKIPIEQLGREEALEAFKMWQNKLDKVEY